MNRGIQHIFSDVAHTYELVNHVLTFGLDALCRRKAAKLAAAGDGTRWLDVCCGTGEMAVCLRNVAGKKTMIAATDFCFPMIRKAARKPEASGIVFTLADAQALPFRDMTFDLITLSFATRNINVSRVSLLQCVGEFYRILKPGGRFVSLETSQPPSRFVRRLFHMYVRLVVQRLGQIISGSRAGYAYLAHTIPRFYGADELANVIRQAGFAEVTFDSMFSGLAAIHKAVR